jgi:addiction module HigA family antidote
MSKEDELTQQEKIDKIKETAPEEARTQSIPNDVTPLDREPKHPGKTLQEFIDCYDDLNQTNLANIVDMNRVGISRICNEERGISTELALKLEKVFPPSAEFWLDLDRKYQLWEANQKLTDETENLESQRQELDADLEKVKNLLEDYDISGKGHGISA